MTVWAWMIVERRRVLVWWLIRSPRSAHCHVRHHMPRTGHGDVWWRRRTGHLRSRRYVLCFIHSSLSTICPYSIPHCSCTFSYSELCSFDLFIFWSRLTLVLHATQEIEPPNTCRPNCTTGFSRSLCIVFNLATTVRRACVLLPRLFLYLMAWKTSFATWL